MNNIHAYDYLSTDLKKEVNKIIPNLDFENICKTPSQGFYEELLGPQCIIDFNYLGCQSGGDWQFPVYFIVYQYKNRIYVYVPVNGNVYNHNTNMAFGDDRDKDFEYLHSLNSNLVLDDNFDAVSEAEFIFNKDFIMSDIIKNFII